ncbi:hypothetical protein QL093DRAFT_2550917 [Fusarium oxysporum]|nr:hypothetical protein QL093DRAFT_2550917 [Fusarium oxysporum]
MSSLPPLQGTVLRSPHHRDGARVRNAQDYDRQPPHQKPHVVAEVGRPLQKLPKGDLGGGRVNQSPTSRTALPKGQLSSGQSYTHKAGQSRYYRQDHALGSQPKKKAPWMDGPVAKSGSRR